MAYESSLNYAVWATSWSFPFNNDPPLSSYPAFVPLIRPVDAIANNTRPYTNLAGLPTNHWDAFYEIITQIPRSRRVYLGYYFQDDGACTDLVKATYYATNTPDGTTYGDQTTVSGNVSHAETITRSDDPAGAPVKYHTFWGLKSAEDGGTCFKAFLQNCISNGVTFDYYWDDTESIYAYEFGTPYNAWGGAFNGDIPTPWPSYYTLPDPRRTPAIVNDYRFTTNSDTYRNLNNRNLSDEFLEKYKDTYNNPAESRTTQQILSYYTNVTSPIDFKKPWAPGGDVYGMYAWTSAVGSWYFQKIRTKVVHEPLQQLGLNTKVFKTDLYPANKDEARYMGDLNTHWSIQDDMSNNYMVCMHNYGDLTDNIVQNYGYVENPQNDYERYTILYNQTRFTSPAYMAFVKELRKLRGFLRSKQNAYENFVSIVSAPSNGLQSRQLWKDQKYWYELIYHICLHGVKFFNHFIQQNNSSGWAELQACLDEWKNISDNNRAIPVSNEAGDVNSIVDRILLVEAATKGIISGGYIQSTGKWIWRLTAAPGITKYTQTDDSDIPVNIEIPEGSAGVWIERTVPGRPKYVVGETPVPSFNSGASPPTISQPQMLTKSPFSTSPYNSRLFLGQGDLYPNALVLGRQTSQALRVADYSVGNNPKDRIFIQLDLSSHVAAPGGWDGWRATTRALYQGDRYGNAANFDNEPMTRAYPFEFDPVDPENSSPWHNILYESCYPYYKWGARSYLLWMPFGGLNYSSLLGYYQWARDFTSTTDKSKCPARWKGFAQAVRAILEGTMSPSGKAAMNEPANICMFLPGDGDTPYKSRRNQFWTSLGTTNEERDIAYYQYLDQYVSLFVSMKGRTSNSGKLYLMFDTMSQTATPNTIESFRTDSLYRTDALELGAWYVFNKLVENGIPCFYEARRQKTTTYNGNTYVNEWAYKPATCGEYWYMWSDSRQNPTIDYATAEDSRVIFRQHDSNYPLAGGNERDFYRSRITTTLNGKTKTLVWNGNVSAYNYYTPHNRVWNFYALCDHYRFYYNKIAQQQGQEPLAGSKSNVENMIAINPAMFIGGKVAIEVNTTGSDPTMQYWRLDTNFILPVTYLDENVWNSTPDPQNYNGGLWNASGKTYWDTVVKQASFNEMITYVDTFCRNYAPVSDDWSGTTYGFDPVALGTIHYI